MNGPGPAAVFILALLAGCSGPSPVAPGNGVEGAQALPAGDATAVAFTDCVALKVTAHLPGAIGPADRPSGWPAAEPSDLPDVVVLALRCARLNVGPFERGPIHVILDWHGDAQAPAACHQGQAGSPQTRILTTILVDDPEVADFLRLEEGMPALATTITEDETPLGLARLHSWTIQVGQASPSEVHVQSDPGVAREEWPWRLFWVADGGLGWLDIAWSGNGSIALRPAQGTFQAPLLMARAAGGTLAGTGQWYGSLDGQGSIVHSRDSGCLEELP